LTQDDPSLTQVGIKIPFKNTYEWDGLDPR